MNSARLRAVDELASRTAQTVFRRRLTAIASASFVLRVVWVLSTRAVLPATDAYWYLLNAKSIAHLRSIVWAPGSGPSAFHPPAWSAVLAVPSALGFSAPLPTRPFQLLACVVGTVTVVFVALAGRELAGPRAGIIAAVIAALYPNVWMWERELAAETLIMPLVAGLILLSYRFLARPRLVTAAGLGAVCAVLALTRGEQILLFPCLIVPLVILRERRHPRQAVAFLAAACVAMAVIFAPWVAYNASRFDRRVLISTNLGPTVRLSNDDFTYRGAGIGSQDLALWMKPVPVPGGDESVEDEAGLRIGKAYARKHLGRLPIVIAAREGRTWNFFAVAQQARIDKSWGHDSIWVFWAGIVSYWLLLPAAVVGVIVLRRRRQHLLPLLAPFAVAVLATAITFGQPRYRAGAEVALVLLAAVAIDALLRRTARHRDSSQVSEDPHIAVLSPV